MEQENGDLVLQLRLAKKEHKAWKGLWHNGEKKNLPNFAKKKSFGWAPNMWKDNQKWEEQKVLVKLEEGAPPTGIDELLVVDAEALCVGIDDFQKHSDHIVMHMHFKRDELTRLEESIPIEEFLRAEITNSHIKVYARAEPPITLFEAELECRIAPEGTMWEYEQAAKGQLGKAGEAFNPALRIILVRHPDPHEPWAKIFAWHQHPHDVRIAKERERQRLNDLAKERLRQRLEDTQVEIGNPNNRLPQELPGFDAPVVTSMPALSKDPGTLALGWQTQVHGSDEGDLYLVDNSDLQANTKGLGFRLSKSMADKDGENLARWGSFVRGVEENEDGWLKVGNRYLPFQLKGKVVLTAGVEPVHKQVEYVE